MDILVCIKQVPGTSNVEVDPVTGVLKRDGVESKLNPYDPVSYTHLDVYKRQPSIWRTRCPTSWPTARFAAR